MIKKILREPIFHFLLLGALAYLYFDYSQTIETKPVSNNITIEGYELERTQQETKIQQPKLALEYLKYKKILLQEAYSLELYKEEKTINDILLKKMEYIFSDNQNLTEPTERQLETFYKKHPNDYGELSSFDLYILKLEPAAKTKTFELLSAISDLRPFAKKYKNLTPQTLQEKFGKYTALKISMLQQDLWSDIIRNDSSKMLVLITNKKTSNPSPFEEIEGLVYKHYKKYAQVQNIQREYKKLSDKYTIEER